jgi:hypothetical protein
MNIYFFDKVNKLLKLKDILNLIFNNKKENHIIIIFNIILLNKIYKIYLNFIKNIILF